MAAQDERVYPSTPDATAAVAQSQAEFASDAEVRLGDPEKVGQGIRQSGHIPPYRPKKGDPLYRQLRIFTLDPATPRLEGAIALIKVPYEPLRPGPVGAILEVDSYDGAAKQRYRQVDLDDPFVLMKNGRDPSPSDPLFHQQMCYAVCSTVHAAFKTALGRDVGWGFDVRANQRARLRIRPYGFSGENAYYDEERGELCFGYYRAHAESAGRNLPGGWVFTSLSHDIIAHEMSHAILHGLRGHFTFPTNPDVLAFHEAFADLVAIFQHFGYREVVHAAIRRVKGDLRKSNVLADLATQFGHTTGSPRPLRTAIDVGEADCPKTYQQAQREPHELGSVLVSAVFDAFTTLFSRKTERYVRLASNGRGVLPVGEMPNDLKEVLAKEASQLASQFLNICIRAIDYCPPVDLEFGDFLRAVITADSDLVSDDHWAYREAWIDAFRRRGIYPRHVATLSEDALIWRPTTRPVPKIAALSFAELQFAGDPAHVANDSELRRQATALAAQVCTQGSANLFGLAVPGEHDGAVIEPPRVESIRSSRRVGPDSQVVFDLVAEIIQRRRLRTGEGNATMDFYGGATVILGPDGDIRYAILKNVLSEERLDRQRQFILSDEGHRYWQADAGRYTPKKQLFRLVHRTGPSQSHDHGAPPRTAGGKTP
jgi:hypothetical protein